MNESAEDLVGMAGRNETWAFKNGVEKGRGKIGDEEMEAAERTRKMIREGTNGTSVTGTPSC